jgi:small subunit ribosomal protein S4
MARYTGPRVRISRRFGVPIFGESKYLDRRNYPPGVHGPKSRRKLSDYAVGLNEKQKLRYYYGLQERQFRSIYEKALKSRGVTGDKMLQLLESRLDHVVYLAGFAPTKAAARQLVGHGHITVDGTKVDISSFSVAANQVIGVRVNSKTKQLVGKAVESASSRTVPSWIVVDSEQMRAKVVRLPVREDISPIANDQAVVEFYSR